MTDEPAPLSATSNLRPQHGPEKSGGKVEHNYEEMREKGDLRVRPPIITMKEPFDERADSASTVDLLQQETEAGLIGQIVTWQLFWEHISNCVPLTVLDGKWGVGCVWGGEPLSEESVWAAGRSVTAGDLEMLLQSPTKEEKRDNTAIIPAGRQPPSDGRGARPSRARLGRIGSGCQGTGGDGSTRETL